MRSRGTFQRTCPGRSRVPTTIEPTKIDWPVIDPVVRKNAGKNTKTSIGCRPGFWYDVGGCGSRDEPTIPVTPEDDLEPSFRKPHLQTRVFATTERVTQVRAMVRKT